MYNIQSNGEFTVEIIKWNESATAYRLLYYFEITK
jgi:hypothetical protein